MGNVNRTHQHNPHHDQQQSEYQLHQLSSSSLTTPFTCEICIEPVTLPNTNFSNCNKCVHPYCTECMIKYIQVKLEDNISDIKCPSPNCDHSLDPLSCRPKIAHQLFDKWCDVLCESYVLAFDRVYCPNTDCSALIVNECAPAGDLKRCVCPNCKKPFCFKCKIPWHAGYRCDESGETRDANDIAFGVLCERKKWMRCPVCRNCVELVSGCFTIHCRCGIKFCYRCGKKVYGEWCNCFKTPTCCRWLMSLLLILMLLPTLYILFELITKWNHLHKDINEFE